MLTVNMNREVIFGIELEVYDPQTSADTWYLHGRQLCYSFSHHFLQGFFHLCCVNITWELSGGDSLLFGAPVVASAYRYD